MKFSKLSAVALTLITSFSSFADWRDGDWGRGRETQLTTCSTSSNGYSFSETSSDYYFARNSAAEQCRAHRRTDNYECDRNVECNDGGYEPRYPSPREPRYPVPPRVSCVANRYDPAGMFIQSYSAWDCGSALNNCNYDIRGRQFCSIAR